MGFNCFMNEQNLQSADHLLQTLYSLKKPNNLGFALIMHYVHILGQREKEKYYDSKIL